MNRFIDYPFTEIKPDPEAQALFERLRDLTKEMAIKIVLPARLVRSQAVRLDLHSVRMQQLRECQDRHNEFYMEIVKARYPKEDPCEFPVIRYSAESLPLATE